MLEFVTFTKLCLFVLSGTRAKQIVFFMIVLNKNPLENKEREKKVKYLA